MDLPEPIRRRLGDFSRTVFVDQNRIQPSAEEHADFLNQNYYKFILITILILMTLIEAIRLYLGNVGNLQEKVPELAGFWLLTLLLQFPLILFQLFNEAVLIQPLERGVHIILALFIFAEALFGFVALRAMVRHTESRFHLRQFDGVQDLRT
ncbi:transmembrane 17 [Labeo rohita]|uniref:Transmembrane 17 n=1 Tax=Labeo rohita TaxID=84645 RepID=A0A498MI30_LABRO|nr:transmembrane 17 [Labeo rohita]